MSLLDGLSFTLSLPAAVAAAKMLRKTAPREMKDEGSFYKDPYTTAEQKARDKEITKLLKAYVRAYESKVRHSVFCRYIILVPCMGIITAFALLLGRFFQRIAGASAGVELTELVSFVTACVSFLGLVVSVLLIITKYFFPENDEQYITQIVKSIQENDLANKQENAKNSVPKQKPEKPETAGAAALESEDGL